MTSSPASARRGQLIAILVLAIGVAGAAAAWYLFLRPAGPPPVSLPSLPAAASSASGAPGSASASPPTDGVAGSWLVDPSVGSFSDFSGVFVGYRVREELATIGGTEAVGRTPNVTGNLAIEGTSITAGTITADLTTLRSNESNRDRQLSRQALETSQFPTATFTLTGAVDLGQVPAEGASVDVAVAGNLTLHGVTKSVQVALKARVEGGVITVAGSLPIVFADYGIQKPQAMVVLSVEDHGIMEFQLHFTRG